MLGFKETAREKGPSGKNEDVKMDVQPYNMRKERIQNDCIRGEVSVALIEVAQTCTKKAPRGTIEKSRLHDFQYGEEERETKKEIGGIGQQRSYGK